MAKSEHMYSAFGRAFFPNLEQLYQSHSQLFKDDVSMKSIERPLIKSNNEPTAGLVESVLRLKFDMKNGYKAALQKAVVKLASMYTFSTPFDVSITFNYILYGETVDGEPTFSVFFGQNVEHSSYDQNTYVLRDLGDVNNIPTIFDIDNVKQILQRSHDANSNVRVYKIVNVIYIFRRYLTNYQQDRKLTKALPRQFVKLF